MVDSEESSCLFLNWFLISFDLVLSDFIALSVDCLTVFYFTAAITSISTSPPAGNAATCTHERAGNVSPNAF